jgi:hypothetical protein
MKKRTIKASAGLPKAATTAEGGSPGRRFKNAAGVPFAMAEGNENAERKAQDKQIEHRGRNSQPETGVAHVGAQIRGAVHEVVPPIVEESSAEESV